MPEKTKFRKTVEILSVVGMEFIAIGKIMFHTPTKIWNIPHLHFLARQLEPSLYEIICLDIQQVDYGNTLEHGVENLIKNIFETLLHIMKNHGDDEVIDKLMASALTHDMDGYWLAYRRIEVDLAKRGEDLGHKYSGLSKSITEAFKEVIREELKRIEGEHENSDYKKILKKLKGATLDIFGWEDNAA